MPDETRDEVDVQMQHDVDEAIINGNALANACKLAWLAGARWGLTQAQQGFEQGVRDVLKELQP